MVSLYGEGHRSTTTLQSKSIKTRLYDHELCQCHKNSTMGFSKTICPKELNHDKISRFPT